MYLIGIWYRFPLSDSSVSYVSQARLSFCFLSSSFFHNTQSTCYKLLSMGFLRCTEHEAGGVAHGRDDIRKLLQRKGALSYRRHHMELDNKFLRPPHGSPRAASPILVRKSLHFLWNPTQSGLLLVAVICLGGGSFSKACSIPPSINVWLAKELRFSSTICQVSIPNSNAFQ